MYQYSTLLRARRAGMRAKCSGDEPQKSRCELCSAYHTPSSCGAPPSSAAAGAALPRDVVATLGSFREPEELLKAFQRAIDQRRW